MWDLRRAGVLGSLTASGSGLVDERAQIPASGKAQASAESTRSARAHGVRSGGERSRRRGSRAARDVCRAPCRRAYPVFHATRFPAYCARLSGDDGGDLHETVWRVAHIAAGEFFVPFWYGREWDSPPGARASKTARNIARWCLEADEGRLAWMRSQVWFEPWICMYARASVRKSLVRHAAPALARSGLTQVRIARALRCSQGTISKVLAGARWSSLGNCPPSTAPLRWTPQQERRLVEAWEARGATEEELLEALSEEFDRSAQAIRAKYYQLMRSRARS